MTADMCVHYFNVKIPSTKGVLAAQILGFNHSSLRNFRLASFDDRSRIQPLCPAWLCSHSPVWAYWLHEPDLSGIFLLKDKQRGTLRDLWAALPARMSEGRSVPDAMEKEY